jgi:hypothetical protein
VEQIEAYLDKIVPLLDKLSAESEILNNGSTAKAKVLTERASRPLVSEKDPEVQREAMQQIVTLAEEKVMDGKKPQVTGREVTEILAEVKGALAREPDGEPSVCSLDDDQEPETESVNPLACPWSGTQENEAVTEGTIDPALFRLNIESAVEYMAAVKMPVAVCTVIKSLRKDGPMLTCADVVKLFGVTPEYKEAVSEVLCFTPKHRKALIAKCSEITKGLCDGSLHSKLWCPNCEGYYQFEGSDGKYVHTDNIPKDAKLILKKKTSCSTIQVRK